MRAWTPIIIFAGLVCAVSTATEAASLQVTPTSFEIPASRLTETLALHNNGTTALNTQIRVYRWSQVDGEDKLEPTSDVVVSPPLATIQPGSDQIIRLVRTTKRAVTGEENYRVVTDEILDAAAKKAGTINFAYKYSIPMFFVSGADGKSELAWSVEKQADKTFIVARNSGNRRARIGGLTVKLADGKNFVFGKGLNGYVLAGSSMRWVVPGSMARGANRPVSVSGRSEEGLIDAQLQATASNSR